jgi:predicted XRE-type DNA-binding protein
MTNEPENTSELSDIAERLRSTPRGQRALASARLRYEILAMLHAALAQSGMTQANVASLLGIRRSAVNQVFRGDGNLRISTLAEYLAAMGGEVQLEVVPLGDSQPFRSMRQLPAAPVSRSGSKVTSQQAPAEEAMQSSDATARRNNPAVADYRLVARDSPPVSQEAPTIPMAALTYVPVAVGRRA